MRRTRDTRVSDDEWREYYTIYIGEETATLEDVAGMAGVTPTTVSNHFRRLGLQAKPRRRVVVGAPSSNGSNGHGGGLREQHPNWFREPETETAEAPEAEVGGDEITAAAKIAADELLDELLDLESDEPEMEMPIFWRPRELESVGAQTSPAASTTLLELARLLQVAGVTGTIRLQLSADLEVKL
jgi:hypothetical protein